MTKIYMVRHGKAAAGWGADKDPGLDDEGRAQSEAVAATLQRVTGAPLPVLSSPLRRCRETAEPLSGLWGLEPIIEPAVAEIPSPIDDLQARGEWLRAAMAGTWADLAAAPSQGAAIDFSAWRQGVVDALRRQTQDAVVFSHFIAINAAAGHALDDDRMVVFRPDNCSVTVFEVSAERLTLVERGEEADTKVN